MASPKDIDSASAAELALVDLLYDELDGEDAESAREAVEADGELSAELVELRDLRSLMRELPDEDPPTSVSAKLLHAAAERAPAKAAPAEEAGFFAWLRRFFQPVMMHPALSAAASLVLVAGVAGALYVSGRVRVSEPTASPVTESRAAAEAHSDLPPAHGTTSADLARPSTPPVTAEPAAPTQQAPEPNAVGGLDFAPATDERQKKAKPTVTTSRHKGKLESAADSPDFDLTNDDGEAASEGFADQGGSKAESAKRPQRELSEEKAADKKADEIRSDNNRGPAGGGTKAGETIQVTPRDEPVLKKPAEETQKEERERDSRLAEVKKLHDRALRAAKDNECDAVISIGAQIRKLDPDYYKKSFITDARLRSCRSTAPNAFQ